jgi:RNA polymerase sigma-70 factor (ECF subfamily)
MDHRERERRFDELYAEHRGAMHAFFLGRTSDPEAALDLLQELFLRAWRSMASLDALPAERRPFWLYSVARNLVVDHYRAGSARQAAQHKLERFTMPEHADAAESEAIDAEQLRRLDAAIWRLPNDLREVLVLQAVGDCNSTQIGEILGQPPGTVRYHLAQARRLLARELSELEAR